MCGIVAALGLTSDPASNRSTVIKASTLLRHRGPDASGVYQSPNGPVVLSHERLSIIDPSESGLQPMRIQRAQGDLIWIVNGEIYNHEKLRQFELSEEDLSWTSSDSAIVGHLFQKYGPSQNVFSLLDGIFAGVIYDESNDECFAFRDPIGIVSFYWGRGPSRALWFASEMKSLQPHCTTFDVFPPGTMYSSKMEKLTRFFNPTWIDHSIVPTQRVDFDIVRKLVIEAVVKRLMTDVPLAVYLSGGLDSSLIASIATRHLKEAKTHSIEIQDSTLLALESKIQTI